VGCDRGRRQQTGGGGRARILQPFFQAGSQFLRITHKLRATSLDEARRHVRSIEDMRPGDHGPA
jgi:hypothetical protein